MVGRRRSPCRLTSVCMSICPSICLSVCLPSLPSSRASGTSSEDFWASNHTSGASSQTKLQLHHGFTWHSIIKKSMPPSGPRARPFLKDKVCQTRLPMLPTLLFSVTLAICLSKNRRYERDKGSIPSLPYSVPNNALT